MAINFNEIADPIKIIPKSEEERENPTTFYLDAVSKKHSLKFVKLFHDIDDDNKSINTDAKAGQAEITDLPIVKTEQGKKLNRIEKLPEYIDYLCDSTVRIENVTVDGQLIVLKDNERIKKLVSCMPYSFYGQCSEAIIARLFMTEQQVKN